MAVLAWSCQDSEQKKEKAVYWGPEQVKEHSASYQDPGLWDTTALNMEVQLVDLLLEYDTPLNLTPFPTPKYKSPGNGNEILEFQLDTDSIIGHTASLGKGPHNEYLFEGLDTDRITYFTILTLNRGRNLDDHPVIASSRNHPNYIAQGSLNANTQTRIDWVAFQTVDGNAYALVNGRLFNLQAGRIILASVQSDKSVRFYQADYPIMRLDNTDFKLRQLLSERSTSEFFD
ncbi:hypothetical protein BST85_00480 [Aureitalea marina]|uniref:Uncharacterized protein n=2 Tax=Aureitalea marina TaxID=930804 RepID=A0A2S7KLM8_9FLAO|nr:hypothetical protein BST85_00480 [Aureitalea marina]